MVSFVERSILLNIAQLRMVVKYEVSLNLNNSLLIKRLRNLKYSEIDLF